MNMLSVAPAVAAVPPATLVMGGRSRGTKELLTMPCLLGTPLRISAKHNAIKSRIDTGDDGDTHEIKDDNGTTYLENINPHGKEGSHGTKGDRHRGKLDEFEEELEKIVGLHDLKMQLRRWAKGMILDFNRRAMGIKLGPRKRPHMAFLGNPGTGKTTVARILGKLLHSTGVLSRPTVTEVQRTDLVGTYIGHTGEKTRGKIKEAMNGILFVDEAYRLYQPGSPKDYGLEALEEIMSVLEDDNIVVVFAGYTEPMKRMLNSNPGFYRRIVHLLHFEDFTCKDLAEMLMLKMSVQDETSCLCGFKLDESCDYESVLALIEEGSTEIMRSRMNGGLVDHMLNNARENLDSRLSLESEGDELFTITLGDLEAGLRELAQRKKYD